MAITIVGLPWTRAALNIARYTLLPFGNVALPRNEVGRAGHLGTGALGPVGNVIWLLARRMVAGARPPCHVALGLALTVIGIPFAWAHLKLAVLSLWPIGRTIVIAEEAALLKTDASSSGRH